MRIGQDCHAALQSSASVPSGDNLTQESLLLFGSSRRRSSHLSKLLNSEDEFGHLFIIGGIAYSLCGRHFCWIRALEDDWRMLRRDVWRYVQYSGRTCCLQPLTRVSFVVAFSERTRAPSAWSAQNYGCCICRANIDVFTALGGDQSVAALVAPPKVLLRNISTEIVNAFCRGSSHRARFFSQAHGKQIYSNAHAAAR